MKRPDRLPDAGDRELAVRTFDRNLVVEAGAGTGKTSLLVERLLVALGSGRVALGDVAAITFTEKAAGEMRERLSDGLETLRAIAAGDDLRPPDARRGEADRAFAWLREGQDVPPDTIRDRALAALGVVDRAVVTTVHGFCAEVLRRHPFDAGVSPEFEVDRGERFASLFPESWETWLAGEFGPEGARRELWSRVLASFDLGTVEAAARQLSRSSIPVATLVDVPAWPDARTLFGAEATRLVGVGEALLRAAPAMKNNARELLDRALPVLRGIAARGLDADLGRELAAEIFAKDVATNKSIPVELHGTFATFARGTKAILRPLARVDDAPLRDLVAAVSPFARRFRESLVGRGLVDFDGLLVAARDLLRDVPEAREALRRRFTMLLVDEFQDTDPIQYEIVLYLGERPGGRARDPFAAELEPGRVFIVGDPKQSIYRFRGADYAAYRRAVRRVLEQGGRALALTVNFRSVRRVLAPVNDLFAGGDGWTESDWQPPYREIDAVREEAGGGPAIELWTVLAPGTSASRRREAEGRLLAERLRAWVAERNASWKDVYVLFRSFHAIGAYARPLREAGIPFVLAGGRTFHERTEVVRFLAVLRLLGNPDDPPAILAWLRSPAGAVPDTELAAFAQAGGRWARDAAPDPSRFPALARAFAALRRLLAETCTLDRAAAIRKALELSDLETLEAFAFEGPQRVANLRKLAARAEDLASDGTRSLVELVAALEERRSTDPEGESPLADENTDAVRLMTIHAAKGLEAPIVVVPDLGRSRHDGVREDVEIATLATGGVPALAMKVGDRLNPARIAIDLEDARHGEAEDLRLLYVALTRARDRLVLFAGKTRHGGVPSWGKALAPWGYDVAAPPPGDTTLAGGRVEHHFLETSPPSREGPVREVLGAPEAAAACGRVEASIAARTGAFLRSPSALAGEPDPESDDTSPLRRDLARAVGVAVHRALERRAAGGVLAVRDTDPEVEREARAILEGFEDSPFARRMAEVDVLARELPILLRDDAGVVWRGRADLVVKERGGAIAVVDYKTDAEVEGAEARYRGQIAVYARAVAAALRLPEPPRAELWLLRAGRIVPVELDA
ncbi:MAG TPA: UvrD-helicase domain-containing protein [Candidatus Polarisedimenticolaceae bacterium]